MIIINKNSNINICNYYIDEEMSSTSLIHLLNGIKEVDLGVQNYQ